MTDTAWPPPWTLKPAYGDPHLIHEVDEDERPLPETVHWDIGFGFAINVGVMNADPDEPLTFDAQLSDADKARGMCRREVTVEQVEEFARLLLNVAAAHKLREAGR